MTKWSPDTRNRMLLLLLGTLGAIALLWVGLVERLLADLQLREGRVAATLKQLEATRTGIRMSREHAETLARADALIQDYEARMAQGDLYRWVVNTLREVQGSRPVVFFEFEPPVVSDLNVPPKVPYKAAHYTVTGVARYADFGAFLADLENQSPFLRLKSVTLEGTAPGLAEGDEGNTLSFRMEFVSLVKPGPAPR